jgi:outer membrane scaffolding protein for murein synthesis (MipA/OmpV family)
VAIAALAAGPARADIPPFYSLGPRPEADVVAGGVMAFRAPRFAGAESDRGIVAPSATLVRTDGFFADPLSGVGWNASRDPAFETGIRATLGLGRDADPALPGMGSIPNRPNVGAFANWNVTPRFQLHSALRAGSGETRRGVRADAGAAFDLYQRGYVAVTLEGTLAWANRRYQREFFGVTAEQSRASGGVFAPFAPGAGAVSRALSLALSTPVHERALLYVAVERSWVAGPGADSPVVSRRRGLALQAQLNWLFRH